MMCREWKDETTSDPGDKDKRVIPECHICGAWLTEEDKLLRFKVAESNNTICLACTLCVMEDENA